MVTKVKRKPYVHLNSRSQALIMTVNKRLRRLRINDCRIETINRIKSTTYRLIFENPKDISRLFYFLYYNVSNDIVFEEEKVKFEKILKT